MLKAGLLECGDIAVLNKTDRPGGDAMLSEIKLALHMSEASAEDKLQHVPVSATLLSPSVDSQSVGGGNQPWSVPALAVCATEGRGLSELAAALESHREWFRALPPEHPRCLARIAGELGFMLRSRVESALASLREESAAAAVRIASGVVDMESAGEELLGMLRERM
jgi:LAO/AO transport system kinase